MCVCVCYVNACMTAVVDGPQPVILSTACCTVHSRLYYTQPVVLCQACCITHSLSYYAKPVALRIACCILPSLVLCHACCAMHSLLHYANPAVELCRQAERCCTCRAGSVFKRVLAASASFWSSVGTHAGRNGPCSLDDPKSCSHCSILCVRGGRGLGGGGGWGGGGWGGGGVAVASTAWRRLRERT